MIYLYRSPEGSNYYNFDVSHDERDIISDEERNMKPKSFQEVMKDVVIYVEIRNAEDNRTAGIKKAISELGVKVNDKLLKYVPYYGHEHYLCCELFVIYAILLLLLL